MPTAQIEVQIVSSVDLRTLREVYNSRVRAGDDSVRAAWRFGQCIDSMSDKYYFKDIAEAMGLHSSTITRYHNLFATYQRPELAVQASHRLETADIGLVVQLQRDMLPVDHGRPLTGRRFRYTCRHCQSHDIAREEITDAN